MEAQKAIKDKNDRETNLLLKPWPWGFNAFFPFMAWAVLSLSLNWGIQTTLSILGVGLICLLIGSILGFIVKTDHTAGLKSKIFWGIVCSIGACLLTGGLWGRKKEGEKREERALYKGMRERQVKRELEHREKEMAELRDFVLNEITQFKRPTKYYAYESWGIANCEKVNVEKGTIYITLQHYEKSKLDPKQSFYSAAKQLIKDFRSTRECGSDQMIFVIAAGKHRLDNEFEPKFRNVGHFSVFENSVSKGWDYPNFPRVD